MFLTMFIAGSGLTIAIIIFFMVLVGSVWALFFTGVDPNLIGLRLVVLFMGVMNALYSIWDIFDDTVRRRVNHSDAVLCAEKTGLPSTCWGVCWCVFSLAVLAGASYVSIQFADEF